MHLALRLACPTVAVLLLPVLPVGGAGVVLAAVAAADLAAVALKPRPKSAKAERIAVINGDVACLALHRRIVPGLRMRRPAATIEAQIRWRRAGQSRRQSRELRFSLSGH